MLSPLRTFRGLGTNRVSPLAPSGLFESIGLLQRRRGRNAPTDRKDHHSMPEKSDASSDVLQAHAHSTLSSEAIAKALARHNREHKGDDQQKQEAQAKAKKAGKK